MAIYSAVGLSSLDLSDNFCCKFCRQGATGVQYKIWLVWTNRIHCRFKCSCGALFLILSCSCGNSRADQFLVACCHLHRTPGVSEALVIVLVRILCFVRSNFVPAPLRTKLPKSPLFIGAVTAHVRLSVLYVIIMQSGEEVLMSWTKQKTLTSCSRRRRR